MPPRREKVLILAGVPTDPPPIARAAPAPTAAIGVFDSGLGGLSVLREIRALLPQEDLVYFADSAYVPYGPKPPDVVRARSRAIAGFLARIPVKAIVVACNTATALAVADLRERFDMPIVAMEPAVKPAVAATRSGVVGVLATTGTLESARFAALLERFAVGVEVVTQPCPGLVECVEAGDLDGPQVRRLIERHTAPLLEAGADTIILGCTHYPFLRPLIQAIAGPDVRLIDTGPAVAQQLARVLQGRGLLRPERPARGSVRFWSSSASAAATRAIGHLWPEPCGPATNAEPDDD